MKQKRVPLRKCTGCNEMKEKHELIRVVKAPEADEEKTPQISLDLTGKKPGRGAYVCKNSECFEKACKARRFERSLCCKIPDEVYSRLESEIKEAEKAQVFTDE